MVDLTLVSLLTAVVASLVAYVMWTQSYWRRRGVVQTRPRFLLGDLWDALVRKRTSGSVLQSIYRKYYKEPFVGIYKFMSPVLVVKDLDLINEVLVTNFKSFANNETIFPEGKEEIFGDNPFSATFDRWKELRARLSTVFSLSRVKVAFTDLATSARCLGDFIAAESAGASLNGHLLSKRFTAHASARVLYGIESHSLDVGSEPGVFYEMGHKVFNGNLIQTLRIVAFFFCPSMLYVIGFHIVDSSVIQFFRKLISDSVEFRHKEGVTRDDFVQYTAKTLLVDGKVDEGKLAKATGQAVNAYIETFETSGITLGIVLLMLATNPKEQERLRTEIRKHVKPGQVLEHDTVLAMPFLEQVMKETLRLFTAGETIRRQCTQATTLRSAAGTSVDVEVGTSVYIPVEAVHRDPAYYSHPDEFRPDHFSPEESESRPKNAFIGWGDGPRMCPGMRYASLQVKAAVVELVRRFEVLPGEQQVLPVQRDPMGNVISILGGIWLKFRPLS